MPSAGRVYLGAESFDQHPHTSAAGVAGKKPSDRRSFNTCVTPAPPPWEGFGGSGPLLHPPPGGCAMCQSAAQRKAGPKKYLSSSLLANFGRVLGGWVDPLGGGDLYVGGFSKNGWAQEMPPEISK